MSREDPEALLSISTRLGVTGGSSESMASSSSLVMQQSQLPGSKSFPSHARANVWCLLPHPLHEVTCHSHFTGEGTEAQRGALPRESGRAGMSPRCVQLRSQLGQCWVRSWQREAGKQRGLVCEQ